MENTIISGYEYKQNELQRKKDLLLQINTTKSKKTLKDMCMNMIEILSNERLTEAQKQKLRRTIVRIQEINWKGLYV